MKIFLIVNNEEKRRKCTTPHPGADYCVPEGACPKCSSSANFGAQGAGKRPSADNRAWEADAISTCCKQPVGLLRVETNTLFGVREDRAVLEGRCRVY